MVIDFQLAGVVLLFFTIAAIYSSAGFGGGSSYLAILSMLPFLHFSTVRTTALICNLIVVSSTIGLKMKKSDWTWKWMRKNASLLLLSIPFAFIAGGWRIKDTTFFLVLGITLVFASLFLFFNFSPTSEKVQKTNYFRDTWVGGVLGALAGLVGIGGGIFLSPYLHFSAWDKMKNITLATSIFIFFNSLAALSGQLLNLHFTVDWNTVIPLSLSVFFGAIVGHSISSRNLSDQLIRKITAVIVFAAGMNILLKRYYT